MHNDRTCNTTADGDPGDEDDGEQRAPDPACRRGHILNLQYDPRSIRRDYDIEQAVLDQLRRPQ